MKPACVWLLLQASAAAGQAELLRQQEELEKKAAELERKEQELRDRNRGTTQGEPSLFISFCMSFRGRSQSWHKEYCLLTGKQNNWPPLPGFFPIKPCFYQDFNEEIPGDFQRVCRMLYYLWMCKWCFVCWEWCSVLNVVVTCRKIRCFSPRPQRDAVPQPAGLSGLFHCVSSKRSGLWTVNPLVYSVHSLRFRLLVPTRLQGLQVSLLESFQYF